MRLQLGKQLSVKVNLLSNSLLFLTKHIFSSKNSTSGSKYGQEIEAYIIFYCS